MDEHEAETATTRAARSLEEFVERVAARRKASADDTSQLDAAAAQIFAAFAAAGIEALLLKGPALVQLLYTADERRDYSDIDVLVTPRDLDRARQTLTRLGCRNASDALGIDDVAGVVHEESWVGFGPDSMHELLIELHYWLAGSGTSAQAAWDALAAHRTFIVLCGQRVSVMDRAGLAMHLAIHVAQHGPAYAKGCRELSLALERWPGSVWEQAAALAAAIEATDPFAAGLRLVPRGEELARALGLPATTRLDWEISNRRSRPRGTFHIQAWSETPGLGARARLLCRALLPAPEWIARQQPWARRHGPRLLAGYALHLLSALPTAARAWRYRRRARRAGGGGA